jgi:hypothetical protein
MELKPNCAAIIYVVNPNLTKGETSALPYLTNKKSTRCQIGLVTISNSYQTCRYRRLWSIFLTFFLSVSVSFPRKNYMLEWSDKKVDEKDVAIFFSCEKLKIIKKREKRQKYLKTK